MNQLALRIMEEVEKKQYRPGEVLPGFQELKKKYEVEQDVLVEAISDLIYEGILERDPKDRALLRVPPYKLWGTITGNHSFTGEAKKRGLEPGVKIVTFKTVPSWPQVRERLKLEEGEEVLVMERLRLADGEPLALEFSYMPAKYYPNATREEFEGGGEAQSSFKVMQEKYGLKSDQAVDEVAVAAIEKREAELLNLEEGTPVLIRFRVTLSDKGVPIKGSRAIYKFKAGYELSI